MEDKELVEQVIRKGDTQCFAQIVNRYSGMIFSKSFSIVRREELAKEVVQQTFIKAYDRLDCWRGAALGAWLTTIAMHTALNILEKEKRRRAKPIELVRDSELTQTETTTLSGFSTYSEEHEQQLQRMEKAIQQLSDNDRTLIELHYYQQLKTEDIARKMGLTQLNVLVKLHRIRERLKKQLQGHGKES